MKRIYLDTSFFGYLVARPSRDLILAARQQATLALWELRRKTYVPLLSGLVLQEAALGDEATACPRLVACAQADCMPITQDAQDFARQLISAGALPATEPADAVHLAVATLARLDYLVSWNFAGLVAPSVRQRLMQHIAQLGLTAPLITTPDHLLEDLA